MYANSIWGLCKDVALKPLVLATAGMHYLSITGVVRQVFDVEFESNLMVHVRKIYL